MCRGIVYNTVTKRYTLHQIISVHAPFCRVAFAIITGMRKQCESGPLSGLGMRLGWYQTIPHFLPIILYSLISQLFPEYLPGKLEYFTKTNYCVAT